MTLIDIICLAILGGVTWMVANDGAWSAGATFLSTLFAGLLAMNYFEPVAFKLQTFLPSDWGYRSDIIALVGLFAGFVFGLRLLSERLAPTYIQVPGMVDNIGRWGFAFGAGYVTMAFLLTAVHTAPLPRNFLGFEPEKKMFFGLAPDRQWLGFTQYVTEKAFARRDLNVGFTPDAKPLPHAFDAEYIVIGDPANPYPNTIFPSFPIRYAQRRGGGAVAAAAPLPAPALPTPAPSAGGGGASPGGGGGAPAVGF